MTPYRPQLNGRNFALVQFEGQYQATKAGGFGVLGNVSFVGPIRPPDAACEEAPEEHLKLR